MSLGDLQIIAFCSYLHFTQLPNSHTDIEGKTSWTKLFGCRGDDIEEKMVLLRV